MYTINQIKNVVTENYQIFKEDEKINFINHNYDDKVITYLNPLFVIQNELINYKQVNSDSILINDGGAQCNVQIGMNYQIIHSNINNVDDINQSTLKGFSYLLYKDIIGSIYRKLTSENFEEIRYSENILSDLVQRIRNCRGELRISNGYSPTYLITNFEYATLLVESKYGTKINQNESVINDGLPYKVGIMDDILDVYIDPFEHKYIKNRIAIGSKSENGLDLFINNLKSTYNKETNDLELVGRYTFYDHNNMSSKNYRYINIIS